MAGIIRTLIVADDQRFGLWLRHHIEALRDDVSVSYESSADFERRLALTGTADIDLVALLLHLGPDAAASEHGLDWFARLREFPDLPPQIIIAENGDELAAVQALRLGATDYLPRRALTPELLRSSLELAAEEVGRLRMSPAEAPPAPPPMDVPRDLIPRYTLLEVLAESSRANVFLARSAALGRNVALKVSSVIEGEEPQFAHEYEAIGALRHPSIVDIYDYGVTDGREFIAMEYFPCGDLKARLQNPISSAQSIDYLRRIAAALSVVHQAGILHRDLKPPNIMLREDGQVVLIDFGLAKSLTAGTHSTAVGVLRGSPYYMSPEQAQGQELDIRSDLYSLGVILYEMLTGSKPYVGATAVEVLQQHVNAPVPTLPAELSRYQTLLDGLMAKSPADRMSCADSLLASLEQLAA
ncbi:MAG: protein kinase [Steroidobacteraceae bacterium]